MSEERDPQGPSWMAHLPGIMSDMGLGVFIGDTSRAVYVNDAFCGLVGCSAEELSAMDQLIDIVVPEERSAIAERVRRRLGGEILPPHDETALLHKDGHRVPVAVAAGTIEVEARQLIIAIFRDLSEVKRIEERLHARARQQAAVVELGERALVGGDLDDLMNDACALVARALEIDNAKVFERQPDAETLLLRAGVGWRDGYVGRATVVAGPRSQAGYALATDGPVITEDFATETRFMEPPFMREHGIVSCLTVVIHGEEEAYGVLGADSTRRRMFSEDDIDFLQAMANVLAMSIRRKRSEEAILLASDRERDLRKAMETNARLVVEAQEVERRHLAREIHDQIGAELTGLKLTLENLQRRTEGEAKTGLERAQGLVGEVMARVQQLSLDLRPAMLDDLGLLPAVFWLSERHSVTSGIQVVIEHSGLGRRLEPAIETAAYRIAQEALTNVARHAGTDRATLRCVATRDEVVIEVRDDGSGFDMGTLDDAQGAGIAGMRERARSVGGRFRVITAPGRGTRVVAELPLGRDRGRSG